MEISNKQIKDDIIYNEEQLLKNDIRNSAKKVSELIENNCIEIAENGEKYIYKTGSNCKAIDGVLYITSDESQLIDLSEDCKLLTYTAARVKENTRTKINCSSIWRNHDGNWKVIFHQRTRC